MATLLRMPEVATGTLTATLASWPVPEGQRFARGETLLVVETDKAAVDVAAEADGVLVKTLVGEGTEVAVGAAVAVLAGPGETVGDLDGVLSALGLSGPPPDPGGADRTAAGPAGPGPAGPGPAGTGPARPGPAGTGPAAAGNGAATRVFASPLARRMARDAGLELAAISATGPNGRIVRRDVRAAIAAAGASKNPPAAAPAGPAAPAVRDRPHRDVPHSPHRRAVAARLTESQRSAPHFYLRATVRAGRLLELRSELNAASPVKISVNDLVVKAVAAAHRRTPALNVTWTAGAVRHFDVVDIAVAIATPSGLVAPVLRDVDRTGIAAVAAAARDLAERARDGRLRQHELDGGTITVTNLGMYGTAEFAAVINPPHAAILAVGAAAREPVVTARGKVRAAAVMHLTLSVDHRPVDGAAAAEWLAGLVELLEHPAGILL